jgi:hypothetical protein
MIDLPAYSEATIYIYIPMYKYTTKPLSPKVSGRGSQLSTQAWAPTLIVRGAWVQGADSLARSAID